MSQADMEWMADELLLGMHCHLQFPHSPALWEHVNEDALMANCNYLGIIFSLAAINGFMFSNMPKLEVCKGDTVAWHLMGLGTEADVHGAVFQGNTFQINGMRRDTVNLFPHTFATAFMQPDNKGKYLYN